MRVARLVGNRERAARGRRRRRVAAPLAAVVVIVVIASACVINGSWAATPAPVVPVQGLPTGLRDVSCVSDDWCMAVGSIAVPGAQLPLVEIWDGARWSVTTAPPQLPYRQSGELVSVDCGTPTSCLARIDRLSDFGPSDYKFLVAWDGERWHEVPPGETTDYSELNPTPYSCANDGTCVAVLQHNSTTVTWDGAQFTVTATPPFSGLGYPTAIDCAAGDDCTGFDAFGLRHWDGAAWTPITFSDLSLLGLTPTMSFSCPTSSTCIGVASSGGAAAGDVGVRWDGTSWTTADLPRATPVTSRLACASEAECVILTCSGPNCGYAIGDPGADGALAWNGASWAEPPAPPAGLTGLSCVTLRCIGVGGSATPRVPVAAAYTWSNP